MADHWLGISSTEYNSDSGFEGEHSPVRALDGDDYWALMTVQVHWLILDLGQTYTIKKIRGRSDRDYDPTDVDIYVSDDKESWGDAVATGADFSDTSDWVEVDTTDKDGRYIKISIEGTECGTPCVLDYGGQSYPFNTIFDAYGDVAAPPVRVPKPTVAVGNPLMFQVLPIYKRKPRLHHIA